MSVAVAKAPIGISPAKSPAVSAPIRSTPEYQMTVGVKLDHAREVVESLRGRADLSVEPAEFRYSPAVKRVLKLAVDEARGFSHNYIGTEHLLLALFRVEGWSEGRTIQNMLQQLHLDPQRLRELIVQELASRTLPDVGARNNVLMCRVSTADLEASTRSLKRAFARPAVMLLPG
jgi:ATP-dependent Clp protease ATP-binding subunit ClpA